MTFELGTLLSLLVAVIAGAVGYGRLQNKNETLKEETESQWKIINELRNWQIAHEKESSQARRDLERDDSKMREMIVVKDGKIDEILRRLDTIDKKIDRLEERSEKEN